jgi:hypothetical protein
MPVSIILSNQNIKLVYARKNTVERWETEALPAGLVKDGRILDPQAMARVLEVLFISLDLPRSEVSVSITGLSFTYRLLTLPHMKPGLQREAIERATQKELKVPLDELYLDWQIFSDTGSEMGVFVSGIPRPLVDALVKTMELAKIDLVHVDIKTLALARAINRADALIVNYEPEWFDIAIISRGVPVTLHSVAPKSQLANLEDNLMQLKDELSRTTDFFNLTHKDNSVSAAAPVILTGSLANNPALADLFPGIIGRPLQIPDSPLKVPANFPLHLYIDNLGLILKSNDHRKKSGAGTDSCPDIAVDPLKGRQRSLAHPLSLRKIAAWAAVLIAILLVIGVSLSRNQATAETARLQTEADRINRTLRISRLALDEAAATETVIDNLKTETLSLQMERESISGRGEYSALLALVSDSLPPEAFLSGITATAPEFILDGEAVRRADIIDYAGNLRRSGRFGEVRIALIEKKPGSQAENPGETCIFRVVIKR